MTIISDAGISDAGARSPEAAAATARSPWYVEAFLAFGGWVAGLLAAGAIFAFIAVFIPNLADEKSAAAAAAAVGALFAAGGAMLARRRRGDFFRHFAIAAVAAGFTAFVLGLWYLAYTISEHFLPEGADSAVRAGNSGLAAAVIFSAGAIVVARAVKDGILTFLSTLAAFGILAVSLGLLQTEPVLAPHAFEIFPAASALLGLLLFTRPLGGSAASAAGAALLIGPMLFYEVWDRNWSLIGLDEPRSGQFEAAAYGAAALYCLFILRARFAFVPLATAALLLLAGIWFLPAAGSVAIVILLAGMAGASRGLAAIGVLALAWFIGRFYHDLALSLLTKSAIMTGLGATTLFGALAMRRLSGASSFDPGRPLPQPRRRAFIASLGSAALLAGSLTVVNSSVLEQESAFKNSRVILLPLGPVDPRSIIQGDYMVLNFRETIYPPADDIASAPEEGEVYLKLDSEGVASFSRFADADGAPSSDEIRVDYKKNGYGQMQYSPTSYFFQEGEAEIFAAARFAIVRVAPDGKTRLTALADENRKAIDPKTAKTAD